MHAARSLALGTLLMLAGATGEEVLVTELSRELLSNLPLLAKPWG